MLFDYLLQSIPSVNTPSLHNLFSTFLLNGRRKTFGKSKQVETSYTYIQSAYFNDFVVVVVVIIGRHRKRRRRHFHHSSIPRPPNTAPFPQVFRISTTRPVAQTPRRKKE